MTTFAFRDGVLAADMLATSGTHRDGYTTKIAKRANVLAASSGNGAMARAFLDWFRDGLPPDKAPAMGNEKDRARGIVFTPDDRILIYDRFGWSCQRAPYYADGSGCDYAYGAMAMGATAEEAVRAALIHETASGGDVQTLHRYE